MPYASATLIGSSCQRRVSSRLETLHTILLIDPAFSRRTLPSREAVRFAFSLLPILVCDIWYPLRSWTVPYKSIEVAIDP